MSVENVIEAISVIENNFDKAHFVGKITESRICNSEGTLGVVFPQDYRMFLARFGAGSFGAQEFYGIVNSTSEDSSIPDAIWLTRTEREESSLPASFVIVGSSGDGNYYCLDTSKSPSPVVLWSPGFKRALEIIAIDFGSYLRKCVAG